MIGNYQTGIDQLNVILNSKRGRNSPTTHYNRAIAYTHLDRHDEAIVDVTTAINLRQGQVKRNRPTPTDINRHQPTSTDTNRH